MPQPAADRNLLFGILAMQMDFITREQLIGAMQAWVFDKSKSLGEILQAQKALAEDNRALLDALVRKHLAQHGNDAEKSLSAISSAGEIRKDLERIADPDVQASLVHVRAPKGQDPYATVAPSVSQRPTTGMRFRIVRPHAKGGLGEVFIARDEELNREVALKEIQDTQADNPESRSRFVLEAEITGGLEHPGIVPVYGLGAYADGRPYYAMRFIRGDSLKDAIDKFHKADAASMAPGQRMLVLRALLGRLVDVCNAIAYAHMRGVLHRDLKPGNIMLGKYGETLVVDWGLAKPLVDATKNTLLPSTEPGEGSLKPSSLGSASATLAGSAVGTPQYMSPEQAGGRLDQLSPASDVYSLGATLYSILTGKSPISETDVGTVLRKVQQGEIRKPSEAKPDVSPALEAVCLKALALKPTERYQSPVDLANDIERWLADEPVTAWKEPWTERARRWIGRNATLVTGTASAVLVALIGLIITTALLTAANERERKAKEDERLAKVKAEENYQLARQAVDRYHTEVSQSVLLDEPGQQALRKKLLEAAGEFYTKFRKERAGDATVQGELGKATFRLAQITADIESRPKAIALHEEAVKLFEGLPGEKTSAEFQGDLAACYEDLGRLNRLSDKKEKGEEYYKKAQTLWDQLARAHKTEAYRAGLARTQYGLGDLFQNERKLPEAEKFYDSARAGWDALRTTQPNVASYQRELARVYNSRAVLYMGMGKDVESEADFKAALKIQQKLVEDHPHVSQYKHDLARTYRNVSYLKTQSGSAPTDEAEGFEEAAKLWTALIDRHPAHTAYHLNLAETCAAMARVYRGTANDKKALDAALQAVAAQRKLAKLHQDDASYEGNLARGLSVLGDIYLSKQLGKEARLAYQEAIKILEPLQTKAQHYRSQRASTWNGMGLSYQVESESSKATEAFNTGKSIWEKLAQEFPDEHEYAVGLSLALCNLGNVAQVAGKHQDAHPYYTQGLACLDLKTLKAPNAPSVKDALRTLHWERAKTYTAMKRYPDALADWDRAIDLTAMDFRALLQLPRANTLARAGKYVDATREVALLVPQTKNAGAMYNFACVYALAVAAVEADKQSPLAERQKLTTEYASASITLLDKARVAGFFKSPTDRSKLETDPDFEAVRPRPEFKKLLSDIKTP